LSLLFSNLGSLFFGHLFGLFSCLFFNNLLSLFFLCFLKLLCQSSLGLSNRLCFLFLLFFNSLLLKLTFFLECFLSYLLFDLFLSNLLLSLFSQLLLTNFFHLFFFHLFLICSCNCDLLGLSIYPNFSLFIHFSELLCLNLNLLSLFQYLIGRNLLLLSSCRSWHYYTWCGLFDGLNWYCLHSRWRWHWHCNRHWYWYRDC